MSNLSDSEFDIEDYEILDELIDEKLTKVTNILNELKTQSNNIIKKTKDYLQNYKKEKNNFLSNRTFEQILKTQINKTKSLSTTGLEIDSYKLSIAVDNYFIFFGPYENKNFVISLCDKILSELNFLKEKKFILKEQKNSLIECIKQIKIQVYSKFKPLTQIS